jgi:hypothetical protein
VLIIFWISFSVIVGIVASSRGRSGFGYFLLSIVLSPLLGLILAVAQPSLLKDQATPSPLTHTKCPACAEFVLPEASVCKHCGHALTPDPAFRKKAAIEHAKKQHAESMDMLIGVAAVAALFAVCGLIAWAFA